MNIGSPPRESTAPVCDEASLADSRRRAEARMADLLARQGDDPAELDRALHELAVHQVELELQNEQLRQAQAALELSRDRYLDLYEQAPVAYFTLDPQGNIVQANRMAATLAEAKPGQLLGRRLVEFVLADDRPLLQQRHARVLRGDGSQRVELRLAPPQAPVRWVALQMTLVQDEFDHVPQCRVAMLDISERVRMQEDMARLAAIVESSEDAIISRDVHGRVTSWNDAARRLFGYAADQMLGRTLDDLVPPDCRAQESELLEHLRDGGPSVHLETERLGRGGVRLPISMSLSPIRDGGRFAGTALIARDISERRRADLALRERVRQLDVLSETGHALIMSPSGQAPARRDLFERVRMAVGSEIHLNYAINDHGELALLAAHGLDEATLAIVRQASPERSLSALAAQRQEPVVVDNLQECELPQARLLRSCGARCFAGYPLLAHGRLYGVAAFASTTRNRFREGDLLVIQTVCTQVSAMLDRSRLLEDLHASEKSLKQADRAKDDFIATLAHELRNPLAPIRNAVSILRHGDPGRPQQLAWCRDIIDRQVVQMTHLLEDLLDVSRLTRNKIELRRDRMDLLRAVEQALESIQPLMDQQRHHLEVEIPQEPMLMHGDLTRLTQVFANLLNNAAKYTDPGGRITVTVRRDGGHAVVSVRDNGIGIDAVQMPRVFDMFSQLVPALERSGGGLGIGLALARGLVDLHGGTIHARSDGTGCGSEFAVRLPLLPTLPHEPGPADLGEPVSLPCCRVLVVDDNVDAAQTLASVLRLHNQDVRTAFGGLEALRTAADWRPVVAVLDIGMADMNGYEVCRRLREQPWGRGMLLIACTGWGQDEDRERARVAGFDAHFVKPLEPDAVLRLLARRAPRFQAG